MDELRWILLVAGVLVVAGIYGFTRWQDRKQRSRGRGEGFGEEVDFDAALRDLDEVMSRHDEPVLHPEPLRGPDPADAPRHVAVKAEAGAQPETAAAESAGEPAGGETKVIVLNVASTDGRLFRGEELVQAMEACGLRFGDHAIYHRQLDTRNGPVSLFSAANILKPGTFEPDQVPAMQSPGIALFLQLPGPSDGLAAFEQMLEVARRLSERLGVKVLDARRCTLSNQALEAMREDLREYRRRAHLAAKRSV